ncbi:formate dehydrogenase subunit delta [Methylophilaceae bacterium]|jgi:formate dehydrogenase subunit delta|nr:formate dehydrogenase subunit delta [Methylophilaceae bacterium]|tara:strand:- start:6312 stop:6530 length:219 start_codon:yes stop_codon:yes gene_type:complete
MKKNHLVTMANQIGGFFKSYPDKEQATKDIAAHLKKFWPPIMRKEIKEYVASSKDNLLDDMVNDAIKKYLKD